jgi:hypothetical protein
MTVQGVFLEILWRHKRESLVVRVGIAFALTRLKRDDVGDPDDGKGDKPNDGEEEEEE